MSIKIEIEGASIEEVADKLLALGHKLAGTSTVAIAAAAPVEAPGEQPKATRARKAKTEPVADAPAAAETVTGTGLTTEIEDVARASDPEPTEVATASSPAADEQTPPPLDFDKDVTPAVLNAVEAHGRDKVAELLGQFGVARAGQLDEARWPELLQALADLS